MAGIVRTGLKAATSRPLLTLSVLTLILLVIRGPHQGFMAYDEGWYAQQARWILQNHDWITQQWWGALQYDRVMGIQWLIAASYALFGEGETAAHLPGMIAALGCVLLTFAIGRQCVGARTALLGAAILAVTPVWVQSARLATQDVPLVFCELLGVWALLRAEIAPSRRVVWGLLAGAAIGLGFMIKGFMVIPAAAAMAPYLLLEHKRHHHLSNPGLYAGLLIGFVPFLLWMGLSIEKYDWLPVQVMVDKLLFLSAKDFHDAGPFYYFWNIPANAFPWPLLAVPGMILALRSPNFSRRWLWLGFPVVLFVELTLFRTRTWYYALQLLPYLSLAAAVCLVRLADAYASGRAGLTVAVSALLASIGLGVMGYGAALLAGWADGFQPAWAFGLLGVIAGAGWLVPLAAILFDGRAGTRSPALWIGGWLLAPWLGILVAFWTGLLGNNGRWIKQPLQAPAIATVLKNNPVDFVFPASNPDGAGKDTVLLTLYTPNPARKYPDMRNVAAGHFAWVHNETLGNASRPYELIGKAENWNLVRIEP